MVNSYQWMQVILLVLLVSPTFHYTLTQSFTIAPSKIFALDSTADSRLLLAVSDDTYLRLYTHPSASTFTYSLSQTLSQATGSLKACAVDMNGGIVVTGSNDAKVRVYLNNGLDSFSLIQTLTDSLGFINSVAISDDRNYIVSGSSDSKVRVYLNNGANVFTLLQTLSDSNNIIRAVGVTSSASYLVAGGAEGVMRVYRQSGSTYTLEQSFPSTYLYSIDVSGTTIVTGNGDVTFDTRVYTKGNTLFYLTGIILEASSSTITAVAVSKDSKRIATACTNLKARVYEDNGDEVDEYLLSSTVTEATGPLTSVRLSSDGGYLFTGSQDGVLRIYYECPRGCASCNTMRACPGCAVGYTLANGLCVADSNTTLPTATPDTSSASVVWIALVGVLGGLLVIALALVALFCRCKQKQASAENVGQAQNANGQTDPKRNNVQGQSLEDIIYGENLNLSRTLESLVDQSAIHPAGNRLGNHRKRQSKLATALVFTEEGEVSLDGKESQK